MEGQNKQGQNQEVSNIQEKLSREVTISAVVLIVFFILLIAVIASKMFRTWISLHRLRKYKFLTIHQKSLIDTDSKDFKDKKLRNFYIASAYRPYVCYYHKYDYVSLEIFKQILTAGARMVELEVFNSSYGDNVEPVVSVGREDGEWKYTLNNVKLKDFLRAIAKVAFNPMTCRVFKDPFILYLNLKTNRNTKCLNKIHKYIYDELGQFLLGTEYAFNDKNNKFVNITLGECFGKVIIMANTGFEGTNLEEVINYSTVSNYTLKFKKNQRRVLYLNHQDIVETEEDIEDYVNTEHHKVSIKQISDYSKCSFTIISPERGSDSLFSGISPINYEPGKGLECGTQFIMMNYQKIDYAMNNYATIFHKQSFIEKNEQDINNMCERKVYEGIKEERVNLNSSEINYLYASTK